MVQVLAMLGEQFMVGSEVCGAVISIRFQVNMLHLIIINREAFGGIING